MPDLSVIIPARNEEWLAKTIEDVFAHAQADTEVIAVLDGYWPDPPLADHPKLRLAYNHVPIGQRAATNLGARMSAATYVMKADAHCSFDAGFDAKLIAADREIGLPNLTQIPAMLNLHAFNWKCRACGHETYQGPDLATCAQCHAAGPFDRVVCWDLKAGSVNGRQVRTEAWRFDHALHFQYDKGRKHREDLGDVMSSIGACFFMRRDRFFEIGGLDEAAGSWGNYGSEIACKSWLSGGRQIVNRRTYFAHLFRTQGGSFGFPYANPGSAVERARKYTQDTWWHNKSSLQTRPLSWLVEKFEPIVGWHTPEPGETAAQQQEREKRLSAVMAAGRSFVARSAGQAPAMPARSAGASKGLAYYSDLGGDKAILGAVRDQILRAAPDLPLVSATLGRLDFGQNLVPRACASCGALAWHARRLKACPTCQAVDPFSTLERGYLTMFRQQLAALEALETDVAFMVEHDVLYHSSHFAFTPPRDDTFYYDQHTWRVNAETGQAIFYYCNQVSGLCASRALLVEHYRRIVAHVEQHGFDRALGFEPGGNSRQQTLHAVPVETWMSDAPNVDIKSGYCLTKWRDSPDQFRNKATCRGWQERDDVPDWGVTKGRFQAFLADVQAQRLPSTSEAAA